MEAHPAGGSCHFVTPGLAQSMTVMGEELDSAVAAAAQGDRTALAQVLRTIRPLVVRYCRARVGSAERGQLSADDVAQEVCLAVMTALPRYQDQGRPFMAFVYGIAAHKVADAHRSAARNRADPVAEVPESMSLDDSPEEQALNSETSRQMKKLLGTLPEKQREILILRLVMGMSAEETAAAVGSTAGAIRVAQHRAIARLKKEVTRAGERNG
ncbi:sigma-70 family RNA polymerase sigma factor [Rhodococcus sp. M8]|nr:sigma-70 family RNA polymerase sigma factor [Rhodococcus sp. M8]